MDESLGKIAVSGKANPAKLPDAAALSVEYGHIRQSVICPVLVVTPQYPLFFEVAMGVSLAYAEQARQLFYRHDFGAAEFGINFVQLSHFNLVYLCICYKCLIIIY
jgi:hypothetical protein